MNKVEKIREEIEKRYEYWKEKESNSHSIESESRMSECNHLLSMIISLSDTEKDFGIKESVIPFGASDSELMEETIYIPQGFHAVIEGDKVIIRKGEDPVNNDLEEAATKYAREQLSNPDYPTYNDEYEMECAFEAGAQWQKEHTCFVGRTEAIEEIKEVLLSEVLPCFMHGGEADEVVAKLDEVFNQK